MNRFVSFESIVDVVMLFLVGGTLSYVHFFIHPVPMHYQLIASSLLAFVLGSFGPDFAEIVKWLLFFCLGILVAACSPQILYWSKTNVFPKKEIFISLTKSAPYCLEVLSVWPLMIPMGYVFYKIAWAQRRYYRHTRFF